MMGDYGFSSSSSDLVQQGCRSAETAKDADIELIAANALGKDGFGTPTNMCHLYDCFCFCDNGSAEPAAETSE
jgi:hypothetical protein